jgi:aryl-alcohol dehydrogenase-like predicted oxidoreductase
MALAGEKGVTVPQIALAYVLHSSLNVYPLVGAANGDEYAQNVRAFDIALTKAEREWLNLERESIS